MDPEILERVKNFCLMDDIFFNTFMQDNFAGMEYVLNTIMERDDLRVTRLNTQYDIPGIIARGVRFDVFCTDADGNEYDFEVQNNPDGASPLRIRYYCSMMDYIHFQRGEDWEQLPSTRIVMFVEQDIRHNNKPLSRIRRKYDDDNEPFDDGNEVIIVNGKYRDNSTAIGRLISDFHCKNPQDMHSKLLADRADFLKSDGKEVTKMCKSVEEYAEKREKLAVFNNTVATIKQLMANANFSAEKALEAIGIPRAEFGKYLAAL